MSGKINEQTCSCLNVRQNKRINEWVNTWTETGVAQSGRNRQRWSSIQASCSPAGKFWMWFDPEPHGSHLGNEDHYCIYLRELLWRWWHDTWPITFLEQCLERRCAQQMVGGSCHTSSHACDHCQESTIFRTRGRTHPVDTLQWQGLLHHHLARALIPLHACVSVSPS